jgi:membrane protease YdiL (CAAX protease family)
MNSEFIWEQDYFRPVISLSTTLFCFLFYHFITGSGRLNHKFQQKFGIKRAQEFWIHFRQLTGFVILGGIPFLTGLIILRGKISAYGLGITIGRNVLYYIIILSVLIISINLFASRSQVSLKKYPLIKTKSWSLKLLIISSSGWIMYLLAYEFLFRGFLLFTCIQSFGIWPAIIINIMIYSLTHVPQGLNETLGAVPFGLVLCYIVVLSGTIWPAFILHVVLAISNEWFSIRNNPEISVRLFGPDKNKTE